VTSLLLRGLYIKVLRRLLHIICSLWLATLLLFGTTPAEAVHAFVHHKDTIHQQDTNGPIIDAQHHHCQFLGFQLMPFDGPPTFHVAKPSVAQEYVSFLQLQDERAMQQAVALREGRGPPAA
jgi:hypothetical protein